MADTENTPPELTLETVTAIEPDQLTDDHRSFLEENKSNLTPEQAEKYGITVEEVEEEIDLDKIDPEVRKKTTTEEEDPKKGAEEDDEDLEDLDPEERAKIEKVMGKKLKPLNEMQQKLQQLEDEKEVDALISAKPEFAKYKGVALKYMAHPAYKNIPAHNIMSMVASKDLMKIGAQKEREAQRKAKDTQNNGTTTRKPQSQGIDWSKATPQEHAAKRAEILGHGGQ